MTALGVKAGEGDGGHGPGTKSVFNKPRPYSETLGSGFLEFPI